MSNKKLTTAFGSPVVDNQNTMTAGPRGAADAERDMHGFGSHTFSFTNANNKRFLTTGRARAWLGRGSGLRGWLLAVLAGVISTRPVYTWYAPALHAGAVAVDCRLFDRERPCHGAAAAAGS